MNFKNHLMPYMPMICAQNFSMEEKIAFIVEANNNFISGYTPVEIHTQNIIERIPMPTMEIFSPEDASLGFFNELEISTFLIKVIENKLTGFWFINDDGAKHIIPEDAEICWPSRFSNLAMDLICKLQSMQLQLKIDKENE